MCGTLLQQPWKLIQEGEELLLERVVRTRSSEKGKESLPGITVKIIRKEETAGGKAPRQERSRVSLGLGRHAVGSKGLRGTRRWWACESVHEILSAEERRARWRVCEHGGSGCSAGNIPYESRGVCNENPVIIPGLSLHVEVAEVVRSLGFVVRTNTIWGHREKVKVKGDFKVLASWKLL